MKFLIESSRNAIYQRITHAFVRALRAMEHTVYLFEPWGASDADFIALVNGAPVDYYIAANETNRVQHFSSELGAYFFERIRHQLIFIHHDNSVCGTGELNLTRNKLDALKAADIKIHHFCIERSNVTDLLAYGLVNVHEFFHASEFQPDTGETSHSYGTTFVGHLMSGLQAFPLDQVPQSRHLIGFAWARFRDQGVSMQAGVQQLIQNQSFRTRIDSQGDYPDFVLQQYLLNFLNKMTFCYRGEMLQYLGVPLQIFGGDLTHGTGDPDRYLIKNALVSYLPATADYNLTRHIYQSSAVNINITGLQFDTGINNRVIDVLASGGLILTDRREELLERLPIIEPLTYNSPDELRIKHDDVLHRDKYYRELVEELTHDVLQNYNYIRATQYIIDRLG